MTATRYRAAKPGLGPRSVFLSGGVPVQRAPAALARRFAQICTGVLAEALTHEDLTPLQYAVLN